MRDMKLVEYPPGLEACSAGTEVRVRSALWTASDYASRSERAHRVLGLAVLATIAAWTPAIVPGATWCCRRRHDPEATGVRVAHVLAGASTLAAGAYLIVWVCILLRPDDIQGLAAFRRDDVTQSQHLSLGTLLVAAGACDVYVGLAGRREDWPHAVYFCNMAFAGLVFLSHPQRTLFLAGQHDAVGLGLLFGAFFLHNEKKRRFGSARRLWAAFPPALDDLVDLDLVVALAAFTVAAATLLRFEEQYLDVAPPDDLHLGTLARCHHGYYLAKVARLFALVSTAALVAAASARRLFFSSASLPSR